MSKNHKTTHKLYSAWNYQMELVDLNRASDEGWQLEKGGCFHSKFVKNPDICYRYQLDYGKIDNMGRYIETFREQGWEYVNSTFNGWHYFRKMYDPSLPEEAYEIFTDRESLKEMNDRWARMALILGLVLAAMTILYGVHYFTEPDLPALIELITLGIECIVMLRGRSIMHNPDKSRCRRGDSTFMAVFFVVLILGFGSVILTEELRPDFSTEQNADSLSDPIIDNRWIDFDVPYTDNYFLDLDMEAQNPMTFEIINESGETVYSVTETELHEDDLKLRLTKGHYQFSMSSDTGFKLNCSIE